MKIETKYDIGQIVYLVTDTEQKERMVISILIRHNLITYELACEANASYHYDIEISCSKDVIKSISN